MWTSPKDKTKIIFIIIYSTVIFKAQNIAFNADEKALLSSQAEKFVSVIWLMDVQLAAPVFKNLYN